MQLSTSTWSQSEAQLSPQPDCCYTAILMLDLTLKGCGFHWPLDGCVIFLISVSFGLISFSDYRGYVLQFQFH